VSFKYDDGQPKKKRPVGDKKTSKKFVGVKDGSSIKKRVYQSKGKEGSVPKSDEKEKTHS
jgi:hypothetical protein